jgi:hypothetical protein
MAYIYACLVGLVACRMSSAVNKASYLENFCCNALSICTNVTDLSIPVADPGISFGGANHRFPSLPLSSLPPSLPLLLAFSLPSCPSPSLLAGVRGYNPRKNFWNYRCSYVNFGAFLTKIQLLRTPTFVPTNCVRKSTYRD